VETSFGTLLRSLRVRAGLSQNLLARRAEIDPAYVNRLERAPADSPNLPRRQVVLRLAAALELGPVDRDRLLVACGLVPASIERLGTWEPSLQRVADVLANPRLSADELTEFREFIRIAAARWGASA
jgi:transcriptional regulator with XRE-family HTH domain